MSDPKSLGDRWIAWVLTRHRWILSIALAVTVISVALATRLSVNGDLRVLLPEDHPVVVSLERIEQTFGSTNSVNFVAKGGTVEARHAFTDALAEALEGDPLLRDVEHGLPSAFFEDHALYYLTDREFEELQELVEAWSHFEVCSRAPDQCLTDPDPEAAGKLRGFIRSKREEAYGRTGFRDRYEREGVEAEVLLVHPTHPANDLGFAREVAERMREVATSVYERAEAPWVGTGMTYNVLGPYVTKADEHKTILRDMLRSGIFAFVGVVAILYMLFRSHRAVLVLLVPLLCGTIWSLGATQLALGRLNVMTSTISTVIMGVGIDAGIHFLGRVRRHRLEVDDHEAILRAFRGLVVPLFVASTTTIAAFLSMACTEFPAFREFGIIAALGMTLCLLAMITVLPALCYLVGIKQLDPERELDKPSPIARWILASPRPLAVFIVAMTVLAAWQIPRVEFEYNGRNLQSDAARANTESDARLISEVFGKDIHASVLVRSTVEEVRQTLATARTRRDERIARGEVSRVAELVGVSDLLPDPALDPLVRKKQIDVFAEDNADILDEIEERAESGRAGEGEERVTSEDAKLLRRMLAADPFTVEQLPVVLLHKLRAADGSWGIYAYPDFDVADMRQGILFMEETTAYVDDKSQGVFVGEAVVYAAMFMMLREEAPFVLALASFIIAGLVYWQLRSLRSMAFTLVPLVLSMVWMLGIMPLAGLKFSLFNLPIVPAILGIGVDNGVYLTAALRRGQGLLHAVHETGGAILGATATTAVGFAAFMLAASGAVRGIGAVAVLGISIAAVAALLVLPTIVQLRRK